MRKIILKIYLGFFALSCIGCASVNQRVPLPDQNVRVEDPTKARIYVVRPAGYVGAAIPMAIYDGTDQMGSTGGKGYLCWEREPGEVKITGKAENRSWVEFDSEAGEPYYIKQSVKMGLVVARNKLELIDEGEGKSLVKKCKPPKVKDKK